MNPVPFPLCRRTLAAFLAAALVAATSFAADEKKDDTKAELAKLAGTWKLEKEFRNGEERKKPDDIEIVFSADGVTLKDNGKEMGAKVKLDASKKPAQIDITPQGEDKAVLGIYEQDGDTLKLAFSREGGDRPTKFESTSGSGITYGILKRIKK